MAILQPPTNVCGLLKWPAKVHSAQCLFTLYTICIIHLYPWIIYILLYSIQSCYSSLNICILFYFICFPCSCVSVCLSKHRKTNTNTLINRLYTYTHTQTLFLKTKCCCFAWKNNTHTHNIYTTAILSKSIAISVNNLRNHHPAAVHICKLLRRYYNREAVVISALQVEKHPLTTPGPFSTPPLPRHPLGKKPSLITMTPPMSRFEAHTSRTASPLPQRPASSCASAFSGSPRVGEGFRSSPKPHSSPKMKLRFCLLSSPSHPTHPCHQLLPSR